MYSRLQAHTRHADGITDTILIIDDVFLRNDMQDALVLRASHCAGRFHDARDVHLRHLLVPDSHHARRVETAHMTAGNAGVNGVDLHARHQLCFLDRTLDRLDREVDVDHNAALQPAGRLRPEANHFERSICLQFTHQRHHFRGADIKGDNEIPFRSLRHLTDHPRPARLHAHASR